MSKVTIQATITLDCDHVVTQKTLDHIRERAGTSLQSTAVLLWYNDTSLPLSHVDTHVSIMGEES